MAQSKKFVTKPSYLCITSNETVQNSKSKPKQFSFLCIFKVKRESTEKKRNDAYASATVPLNLSRRLKINPRPNTILY
jgi:hypothetical protein